MDLSIKKGEDCIEVGVFYMCHDGAGNYLLSKRNNQVRDEHGTWDTGAGALEFGDTIETTLAKEIMEEYCVEVLSSEFLGFRDVRRTHKGKQTHWVMFDFKVLIDRESAKNGEPHKFDEIGWFRLDSLPSPLHSQFPFVLEKYKGRI